MHLAKQSSLSSPRARRIGGVWLLGLALSTAATLGLGACKNKKDTCKPDDYAFEEIAVHIQADEALNQTDEGESLPTVVRVFQLNGDIATRALDFNEAWTDPEAAFGDEYISHKEITLHPDTTELIELPPEDGAKFILVFAGYNSPVGNTWFRVYEIPDTYGEQACELKDEKKDPATLGQPCVYIYMERNNVDGGKNVPPGFDEDKVETTCTPIYTPKTVSSADDDAEGEDEDQAK